MPLVTNILKCDGKVEAIDSFTSFMQLSKRHYFPYSIATQTGVAVTHFSQLGVEVIISTPNATDHLRPRELESDEAKEKKHTDLKCCFEEELGA